MSSRALIKKGRLALPLRRVRSRPGRRSTSTLVVLRSRNMRFAVPARMSRSAASAAVEAWRRRICSAAFFFAEGVAGSGDLESEAVPRGGGEPVPRLGSFEGAGNFFLAGDARVDQAMNYASREGRAGEEEFSGERRARGALAWRVGIGEEAAAEFRALPRV